MKSLASFSKAEDAHLLRARLEGSGIAAYVRDENMVSVDWLYSNAIGGVKVDVADEDFIAAAEVANLENGEPAAAPRPAKRGLSMPTLFLLVASGTFLLVALDTEVIAYPSRYALPTALGLATGLITVGWAMIRRRHLRTERPTASSRNA